MMLSRELLSPEFPPKIPEKQALLLISRLGPGECHECQL